MLNRETSSSPQAAESGALPSTADRGPGALLRAERERYGMSLPQVAERIRIRQVYLAALEQGDYDKLPGRIYITGFLRSYAEFLGLDPQVVIDAYRAEARDQAQAARLVFPTPTVESHAPRLWMVVVALLLAAAIYGAWHVVQNRDRLMAELVSPVPGSIDAAAPPLADPAAREAQARAEAAKSEPPPTPQPLPAPVPAAPAPVASAPVGSAPGTSTGAPGSGVGAAVPPPALEPAPAPRPVEVAPLPATPAPAAPTAAVGTPPAQPTAAAPAGGAGQVYGVAESARSRLTIRATADAWVDIRGPNNEAVLPSKVLKAGDSFRAPDRGDLSLWTGNLGGLEFIVDGKPLPRLGASGEARRNISLDADRLAAGTAITR